jgi:hypothetical protein
VTGVSENEGSSRTRIVRPAARVPPADWPPIINPFLRDTESASTFATAYQFNFRDGLGKSWRRGLPISRPRSCHLTESGTVVLVRGCSLDTEPNRKQRRIFWDKPILDVQRGYLKVRRKVPHKIVVLIDIAKD